MTYLVQDQTDCCLFYLMTFMNEHASHPNKHMARVYQCSVNVTRFSHVIRDFHKRKHTTCSEVFFHCCSNV